MMEKMRNKKKKGFTLIELIVVIVILAILAAIAIPRLSGSRDSANRSAILANLRSIESAVSIAEAEGAAKADIDMDYLIDDQKYLAKEPVGPGTTSYEVAAGVVSCTPDKSYGFVTAEGGSTEITPGSGFTLETLFQP